MHETEYCVTGIIILYVERSQQITQNRKSFRLGIETTASGFSHIVSLLTKGIADELRRERHLSELQVH